MEKIAVLVVAFAAIGMFFYKNALFARFKKEVLKKIDEAESQLRADFPESVEVQREGALAPVPETIVVLDSRISTKLNQVRAAVLEN